MRRAKSRNLEATTESSPAPESQRKFDSTEKDIEEQRVLDAGLYASEIDAAATDEENTKRALAQSLLESPQSLNVRFQAPNKEATANEASDLEEAVTQSLHFHEPAVFDKEPVAPKALEKPTLIEVAPGNEGAKSATQIRPRNR